MELKEVPTEDLIKELYKRADEKQDGLVTVKFWTNADIHYRLIQQGYLGTDENIGAVIHWLDGKLYKRRMGYDC